MVLRTELHDHPWRSYSVLVRNRIHILAEALSSSLSPSTPCAFVRHWSLTPNPNETQGRFGVADLFGLLDAPLHPVKHASITRILTDFLDLGKEDTYFQFRPDRCSQTRVLRFDDH
jgi:hypothetical protein